MSEAAILTRAQLAILAWLRTLLPSFLARDWSKEGFYEFFSNISTIAMASDKKRATDKFVNEKER